MPLSRREWLRLGGLSLGGLGLPGLLRSRAGAELIPTTGGAFGRAKNCIVLFLSGGPPQHETWDPKPDASVDIRGPYRPIPTSVPGLHVGELMPLLAKQANRWAVLRAVQTKDNAHSSSGYYMLTGEPHQPKNQENATAQRPNLCPSLGSVVNRLRPQRGAFPSAITLPEHIWNTGMITWPGQDAGFLGRAWDPWLIHCDPNEPAFQISGLAGLPEVAQPRLSRRLSLAQLLETHGERITRTAEFQRHDIWTEKAVSLLSSPQARQAFELEQEPAAVRERYGRHRFGQSVLLARRLVEAGVSLVQVNWTRDKDGTNDSPMWDTHQRNAELLKTRLMPPMDAACSTLIEDLSERGLLDETLVVWMGEFGRTPKINAAGGRDHWGDVFSIALAGGGIQGGAVHGASDAHGAQPHEGRVGPEDVLATIFHCLGLSADATITDTQGRPHSITRGEPIGQIM
ncbi:MAG: DUF1501 domain-containing protein [Pirellulales bacterium]